MMTEPTGFEQQQRDVLGRATSAVLATASRSNQSGQLSSAACLFLSCAAVGTIVQPEESIVLVTALGGFSDLERLLQPWKTAGAPASRVSVRRCIHSEEGLFRAALCPSFCARSVASAPSSR